jgi:hypothetical protein
LAGIAGGCCGFVSILADFASGLPNVVVAKGYLTKRLANRAVKSYIGRHEPKMLIHLELVANTVSVEEGAHQHRDPEA